MSVARPVMSQEAEVVARPPLDRLLLAVTLVLIGVGLIMVLSSSQALGYVLYHSSLYFAERQAVGVGLGLVAMLVISRLEPSTLRRWSRPGAAVLMLLMVLVAVPHLGVTANSARRWFSLGPLGTFQPSEFAKLAFAVFIADWLARHQDRLTSLRDGFMPFLILMGLALAPTLLLQKDLGTTIVLAAIFTSAYWAAGGRKRHLVLLALVVALALGLVTLHESYRVARFSTFLDPLRDPLGTGFQSTQALFALGSGGPFGLGLGHSVEKYLWLPEAHTDFIFAIVGEETGLWGTSLLLLLFLAFALRGYRLALRSSDRFCLVAATSITTWVAFQGLINMAGVTDTLPIAGVPMPFVSYGGTAVSAVLGAVGVLLAISRRVQDRSYQSGSE